MRLEERGLVRAKWGVTENNRKARFYSITAAGRHQLAAEGVRRIALVAEDPSRWSDRSALPVGRPGLQFTIHGRDEMDAVQRELRDVEAEAIRERQVRPGTPLVAGVHAELVHGEFGWIQGTARIIREVVVEAAGDPGPDRERR